MHNHLKLIIIIVAVAGLAASCKSLFYNIPGISDYKIFPSRAIENSPDSVFYFSKSDTVNDLGKVIFTHFNKLLPNVKPLDDYMEESKTAAFLIIRNDTILYSRYNGKYQENSIFNIFSVTKIFITTLVGIAIDEGLIKDIDEPATDYIPELLAIKGFDKVTIRHLLLHTSGIKFSYSRFNPFSDNSKYYYSRNLRKLVLKSELYENPGTETHYSSANVQLLAMILERATGKSISSYLQEKIWQSIGMQYNASWSLDNKGEKSIEKGFSCLNCTAIDLAKLGRIYLKNGVFEDRQILSQSFIEEATKRDTSFGSSWDFQYNFILGPEKYGSFFARGLYGQLMYIYPKKNIIIVRIGEADLKYNPDFLNDIVLEIVDQI